MILPIEFTQAPVRPHPARGLHHISDCGRYSVYLSDRICGDDVRELGLEPRYIAIYLSPDGQRAIRSKSGRERCRTFAAAVRLCKRHAFRLRQAEKVKPKFRRRRRTRKFEFKQKAMW